MLDVLLPECCGGWVYYDPTGGGNPAASRDDFSKPRPLQMGNVNLLQNEGGGPGPGGTPAPPYLPPAPNGTFVNVPYGTLGSNAGNSHNYGLNPPGPVSISMDTGTQYDFKVELTRQEGLHLIPGSVSKEN